MGTSATYFRRGLLLIWRTLEHTKSATSAAKDAADAAWSAVDEAKETSYRQLMSFISEGEYEIDAINSVLEDDLVFCQASM